VGLLRDHVEQISRKERSSVELVTAAVEAAEKLQPTLNAFTRIYAEDAFEQARATDARGHEDHSLLGGVPVAVKDLFDVAGRVTSGSSRAYLDAPPADSDAPAVAALRRAGGIVIGKTNMHELAFGATTTVSCFGPTNNPWDPECMPGGSSGGSAAAVAARIVGLALGSDTGGSIRIPSSFCGTSGLKTTWGLLPLHGVLPMAPTLDSVGPIATDVSDLTLAYQALTGDQSRNATSSVRVGIARDRHFDAVDPEVATAVEQAAAQLAGQGGARDVPVPWVSGADDAWITVALAEFGREHRALIDTPDALDPAIYAILFAGVSVSAEDERRAREGVVTARSAFERTMNDVDVLVMPSTPYAAPRHEEQTVVVGGTELPVHLGGPSHFTRPISPIAAPALAVPVGFTSTELPIGAQLVGRRGTERLLLEVGSAYQRETDWHTRVPPVHA
jgi:aspartyl-tRNA(Asn)/glutamyl-tRNA(Gln) amidotransferase subunit A